MSASYVESETLLDRALNVIPLGAQTFSKSITQLPRGVSPFFATRAKGQKVWDADGNAYVDFVNALAAITIGHADPEITAAAERQMQNGTIFSLSHPLEAEVAERIVAMVPCAEMVRFGKNGSDATAGAIRIARAYTGRDYVLACGYHGWQDWYIGATLRHRGVPEAVRALTHTFPYDDLPALEAKLDALDGKVAAVILEPMNARLPSDGYLAGVRALTERRGVVLVFDETITGFRFANGGAQERFGVTPDLATFGKGLANGWPLAAVAGRRDLMREMEEIFFSFTMGGEAVSLAAARAVLDKLIREPVLASLAARGGEIVAGLASLIERHGSADFLSVSGDPTWSFFNIAEAEGAETLEIKTLWMQEMLARGILTLGTHNVSYAHGADDVAALLAAYDETLSVVVPAVRGGAVCDSLRCEPLRPLFRIR